MRSRPAAGSRGSSRPSAAGTWSCCPAVHRHAHRCGRAGRRHRPGAVEEPHDRQHPAREGAARGVRRRAACSTRTPTPTSTPRSGSSGSSPTPTRSSSSCAWTPATSPTATATTSRSSARFPDRIGYVHLKQMDPEVRRRVPRRAALASAEAVALGVMVEPPSGVPAMPPLLDALAEIDTDLFAVVEQDLYPVEPTSRCRSGPGPRATSEAAASAPCGAGRTDPMHDPRRRPCGRLSRPEKRHSMRSNQKIARVAVVAAALALAAAACSSQGGAQEDQAPAPGRRRQRGRRAEVHHRHRHPRAGGRHVLGQDPERRRGRARPRHGVDLKYSNDGGPASRRP